MIVTVPEGISPKALLAHAKISGRKKTQVLSVASEHPVITPHVTSALSSSEIPRRAVTPHNLLTRRRSTHSHCCLEGDLCPPMLPGAGGRQIPSEARGFRVGGSGGHAWLQQLLSPRGREPKGGFVRMSSLKSPLRPMPAPKASQRGEGKERRDSGRIKGESSRTGIAKRLSRRERRSGSSREGCLGMTRG